MAFVHFRNEKVDIAIIETGLGGRLDSTNVILPELSVITNIGMDHMQFLGNDILSIAREKAGIIKAGIPVVIGQADAQLRALFTEMAQKKHSPIVFSEDKSISLLPSDLKGDYQKYNIHTTLNSIKVLQEKGWKISPDNCKHGLLNVRANTGLAGRWDVLREKPKVICDTGHNKEGIREIVKQLANEEFENLHIVLGTVNDKSITDILALLPKNAIYYYCQASVPRSLKVEELQKIAYKNSLKGSSFHSVGAAYADALKNAKTKDLIFVGGSTFVVADFLQYLNEMSS